MVKKACSERYMDIQVLKLWLLKSWVFFFLSIVFILMYNIQNINIIRIVMITTAMIGNLLLTHWKIMINNANLSTVIPRSAYSSQAPHCVSLIMK